MTTQLEGVDDFTLPAAADFSTTGQYRGMYINTSGNVAIIANGTTYVDGILQNAPKSAEQARIGYAGIRKVYAGASVTVGALASFDTTARAVISATSGDLRFGKFLDAGAVGDVVRVLMQRGLSNVP